MLVKSLVAGTVLTLLAGGVVYYGTDVDGHISTKTKVETSEVMATDVIETTKDKMSETKLSETTVSEDNHPHSDKATASSDSSADIPSIKTTDNNLIDPKSSSVKMAETMVQEDEASDEEETQEEDIEVAEENAIEKTEMMAELEDNMSESAAEAEPETTSEEKPTRKWIDRYLKSEAEVPTEKELVTEAQSDTPETMEDMSMEDMSMEKMDEELKKMDGDELSAMVDQQIDRELFTEEDIMDAEAKGFETRAKQIENIWVSEDGTNKDPVTLHDIMKNHNGEFIREGDENTVEAESDSKNIEVDIMKDDDGTTTIETETIDMGDGKVMKIVKKKHISKSETNKSYGSGSSENKGDKKKMCIKVKTNDKFDSDEMPEIIDMKDGKKIKIRKKMRHCSKDHHNMKANKNISQTAQLIMEQAEKISMPELRDRAYLDLVSYALDNGDKATAKMALSKIEQVELRDTARNRMAVAFAKAGKAKKAFAILEDLEVDALRDVMRLQVIEALIVPEEIQSEDMQ